MHQLVASHVWIILLNIQENTIFRTKTTLQRSEGNFEGSVFIILKNPSL